MSGIVFSLNFDPLPPAIYARHSETNALGLTQRNGKPLTVVLLTASWSETTDDETVSLAVETVLKSIEEGVDEFGALDPYVYLNYAAKWQDPIASYGAASLHRLAMVQERFDPYRIFTDRVPGGFKLART